MRERARQGGFTLTEMMVVIAIIGILAAMAGISMHPQAKTLDVANRVGDFAREASRDAVSLGPVRSDVVTARVASGSTAQVARSRTRITASGVSGGPTTFKIEKLVEAASPSTSASWVQVATYTTDKTVAGISWAPGVGSQAALASGLSSAWSGLTVYCLPDGTCQPFSLFFQNTRDKAASPNYHARLSILPLGGDVFTRADWN